MMVDEFYFHHRRGLPQWERWGHPLDTLTVLACYLFLSGAPATTENLWIFGGLVTFSSLFVTKDEFVHTEVSSGFENWLHSLLFVLHPISLGLAGIIWFSQSLGDSWNEFQSYHFIILGQTGIVVLFLIYQIGYWNFYAKK
jgi:hypothetical protein